MFSPNAYRILIVEDDAGAATLQKRAVERAGYETVLASSAEEGLAPCARDRFTWRSSTIGSRVR